MSDLETPLMESERTRIAHAKEIMRLNEQIQRLEGEVKELKQRLSIYREYKFDPEQKEANDLIKRGATALKESQSDKDKKIADLEARLEIVVTERNGSRKALDACEIKLRGCKEHHKEKDARIAELEVYKKVCDDLGLGVVTSIGEKIK